MLADTHCHLDFKCFDSHHNQLLIDCLQHGISQFINPAIAFSNWQKIIDLSLHHPSITPAIGLHPCYALQHTKTHVDQLAPWVIKYRITIIGEIGLDKRFLETFEQQRSIFHQQLIIAQQLKKPVILHSVKAHNEVISALREHHFTYGGIIHAFSGSYNIAKAYCDLGFKLGIGSILHYPNSQLIKVLPRIGGEHTLLETDSPDMPLPNSNSQINTPLSILKTFDLLSAVLEQSPEDLRHTLHKNLANLRISD